MFSFNPDKYEFWKIYDCISKYYPIGITKDHPKLFNSFHGLKDLTNILVTMIHDEKTFHEKWETFEKTVEQQFNQHVRGTTHSQAPCYSSLLQLSQTQCDGLVRTKELHFFVSLIGPFYTVIGSDRNEVKIGERCYHSTNYLVVSPEGAYATPFQELCTLIEKQFDGYRFVPFAINAQKIIGLSLRYTDAEEPNIFAALFNDHIDLRSNVIGDDTYGIEKWIKKEHQDNGPEWTSHPVTGKFNS